MTRHILVALFFLSAISLSTCYPSEYARDLYQKFAEYPQENPSSLSVTACSPKHKECVDWLKDYKNAESEYDHERFRINYLECRLSYTTCRIDFMENYFSEALDDTPTTANLPQAGSPAPPTATALPKVDVNSANLKEIAAQLNFITDLIAKQSSEMTIVKNYLTGLHD